MFRSNKRIQRHSELLQMLILHPQESEEAWKDYSDKAELTNREERSLLRSIKERVNGSDHSQQES
jgi:hypothetical protein